VTDLPGLANSLDFGPINGTVDICWRRDKHVERKTDYSTTTAGVAVKIEAKASQSVSRHTLL